MKIYPYKKNDKDKVEDKEENEEEVKDEEEDEDEEEEDDKDKDDDEDETCTESLSSVFSPGSRRRLAPEPGLPIAFQQIWKPLSSGLMLIDVDGNH